MNIIICDDDHKVCDSLELLINNIDKSINVIKFHTYYALEDYLLNNYFEIDAIFMDIELSKNDYNGIKYACDIFQKHPYIRIIFITGYPEKYIEDIFIYNFNFSPYGFLKKPISIEKLNLYINRLKNQNNFTLRNYLKFKPLESNDIYIPINDIMYVFNSKKYIYIYTHTQIYKGRYNMKDIEKRLKNHSPAFYRCHVSYIINVLAIDSFNSEGLPTINGTVIPISNSFDKSRAKKHDEIIILISKLKNFNK